MNLPALCNPNERYFNAHALASSTPSSLQLSFHVFMFAFFGINKYTRNIDCEIFHPPTTNNGKNHNNNVLIALFITIKKNEGAQSAMSLDFHSWVLIFIMFFLPPSKYEFDWRSSNEIKVPLTFMCLFSFCSICAKLGLKIYDEYFYPEKISYLRWWQHEVFFMVLVTFT